MSQAIRITGTKVVAVTKYSRFDPSNPEKAEFDSFSLVTPDENGGLGDFWTKDGYVHVGLAKVEIELMPQKEVTTNAVAALRKQKEAVLAEAQLAATRIEGQIQSLLAITNEASA